MKPEDVFENTTKVTELYTLLEKGSFVGLSIQEQLIIRILMAILLTK